jgi:hypothetical protein
VMVRGGSHRQREHQRGEHQTGRPGGPIWVSTGQGEPLSRCRGASTGSGPCDRYEGIPTIR